MPPRQRETVTEDKAPWEEQVAAPEGAGASPETQAVAIVGQIDDVNQKNLAAMQTLFDWLASRANSTDEDQMNAMAAIVAEILAAESPAEVLAESSGMSGKDYVNKPFLLHGFDIREGSFEDSPIGFYAAITAGHPSTDRTRIITCGAVKVLAKLMKLEQFGEFPQIAWFTAKKTAKGFTALNLSTPTEL